MCGLYCSNESVDKVSVDRAEVSASGDQLSVEGAEVSDDKVSMDRAEVSASGDQLSMDGAEVSCTAMLVNVVDHITEDTG